MNDRLSTPPPQDGAGSGHQGGGNAPEYSVSELSGAIKRALEEGFGYVRLKGEVSGYRGPHSSGHCYFALKDDKAKIEAVIWKGVFGRLRFRPEEGMEVVAQGRITTFPGSSKYQIVIETLEPAGAGALMALLEQRKRKFTAAGLFDDSRKKPRPFLPRVVGIVTSPTGAVIRDMLHGFDERFPTHVIVWPVRVQGETSAAEVAAAIRGFNALRPGGTVPRPDVLIVARGGGSLEDLWGFNEEVVVEAVAASAIPLISAVGHETDWTLIDLVADARAPTPTKAAEWAVPRYADLIDQLDGLNVRQRASVRRFLSETRTHLKAASRGLPRLESLIAFPRQRFDEADKRLGRALIANTRAHALRLTRIASRLTPGSLSQRLSRGRERLLMVHGRLIEAYRNRSTARRRELDALQKLLASLSYQSVLARGYALVRDSEGRMVRLAAPLHPGDSLSIEFADGRIGAEVKPTAALNPESRNLEHGGDPGVKRPRAKPRGGTGSQGSLF